MKITMLGTGTGMIRPDRRSPSVLLETLSGESAIVDAGWGVPEALREINFPLHTLSHLAITHSHADHMATLPSLIQSQLIANLRGYGPAREDHVIIHGYPGIKKDIVTLREMQVPEPDSPKREPAIVEHGRDMRLRMANLAISGLEVRHIEALRSVSYSFEADNKKVVVTGDLGWEEDEQKLAKLLMHLNNADMAIMDSSATHEEYEQQPVRSHLSPYQCGLLAARAGIKHLVLTSLTDRESEEFIIEKVHENYDGELTIPHDGQVFELV